MEAERDQIFPITTHEHLGARHVTQSQPIGYSSLGLHESGGSDPRKRAVTVVVVMLPLE